MKIIVAVKKGIQIDVIYWHHTSVPKKIPTMNLVEMFFEVDIFRPIGSNWEPS